MMFFIGEYEIVFFFKQIYEITKYNSECHLYSLYNTVGLEYK